LFDHGLSQKRTGIPITMPRAAIPGKRG
jgi:hypothetical protein